MQGDGLDKRLDFDRTGAEAVQICQELIRINTTNPYSGDDQPGDEAAGQDFIEPLLREVGARTHRFDPPADIYERMGVIGPRGRRFDGRPNLVAEWVFGSGRGPRILLQGHIDTVGVRNMQIDPFSGHIENGQIWGRGASDMKGAMGATIAALRAVARRAQELNGSIVFMSVVDEECDGLGAGSLACMERGFRGDVALSTDGTGPAVVRGYGGVLTARIVLQGRGGHAAAPINLAEPTAMERALRVAQAILDFRAERWQSAGLPTNLGVFQSGAHPATVPSEAVLGVNISYSFAEAVAAQREGAGYGGGPLRAQFEARVRAADPTARVEWVKDAIPFETPADHPQVQRLAELHRRILGPERAGPVRTELAWTDACHLWYHGRMPTLVYGAGTPGMAHSERERTDVWRVEGCARVLAAYLYTTLRAG